MNNRFRLAATASLLGALMLAACSTGNMTTAATGNGITNGITNARRVLLVSIDGLHEQDLANCTAAKTCPNIASLAQTGVTYSNAYTPGLSDSFPGLAAILTGGSPNFDRYQAMESST